MPDTTVRRRSSTARSKLINLFEAKRAWTAAEIHRNIRDENLTTVYRNIRSLLAEGLIREVCLPGIEAHYEKAGTGHHAHLVCQTCGAAECVPCPVPARFSPSGGRKPKPSEMEHHLEFHGLCSNCR